MKFRWLRYLVSLALLVAMANTFTQDAVAARATVVDGDTLIVGGTTFRLHGIDAPEEGQLCKRANGSMWHCGERATDHLGDLVRGAEVTCDNRGTDDYDRIISVCRANGIDLNQELVRQGLAWAFRKYSTDYVEIEDQARAAAHGVWQAPTETPWEYRERRWQVAKQTAPEGCPIKGNISQNGRIYHAPWSPWYDRTRVSPAKGERWFCSERDAINAGWRAPRWGRH